jgi:ubiquinone/menaquinone biosynthesis C-methylase UbiE
MNDIKLHLGCGNRYLEGYIHIDLDTQPHIDYIHDIRTLPMFDDESVDLIYSCGTFVYFDREEALVVLKEWQRVLKPGGRLRTSVPDFESIVQVYLDSGKTLEARGILGPLFGKWGIKTESDEVFLYQKTTYDYGAIKKMLETTGFKTVGRYNWWEILPPEYDDYSMAYIPHMDRENGLLMSLNVEAVK